MKIKKLIKIILRVFSIREFLLNLLLNKKTKIKHKNISLIFYTPNQLCEYRANSFSTKEPDTLYWIDSFQKNNVFYDIGANVGIYSIYAAKRGMQVVAFEPSLFNLEILARNVNLNCLQETIRILPIALNSKNGINKMRHSTTQWGGALSTFEKQYGFDGKTLNEVFSYLTLGITLDFTIKYFNLLPPDYIKLDVDGIEHLILQGGTRYIKGVKEILVEVNEHFEEQNESCNEILKNCGFTLISKGNYPGPSIHVVNQIWKNVSKI
ncbi:MULTISPECIES: FkbM family methyltransferase [Leptospira]|uniref:FkbM family methyltransferase n=1 Tax=Leptospira TaxID=171 RepID=UPI0002BB653A|nr:MULTISPECIES: FkbM family methyltransferase [Leptospira]ONF76382.1 methyltransferase FkbM [Leptospira santarosai serovar Bananal]EMF88594.1 methyltransferase FkbM domain protein [Leptospira santarosai str. ST188]OLY63884.1 methyltransferase FkbM [Leptospira santarosai serovar Grippotyphosa]ONF82741.1 methyltransferase FkbM [Leptospira santarosai serovar Grippotyphosa]UOG59318.1 FkbM family methyltransferase [Leptospira noguchii]